MCFGSDVLSRGEANALIAWSALDLDESALGHSPSLLLANPPFSSASPSQTSPFGCGRLAPAHVRKAVPETKHWGVALDGTDVSFKKIMTMCVLDTETNIGFWAPPTVRKHCFCGGNVVVVFPV